MRAFFASIQGDCDKVDALLRRQLRSDVALISTIAHYIVNSGGKRLRPQLCLLGAHCVGYEGEHHYTMAAVIELIHTATLLHDDIVDASEKRRGKMSANRMWGADASVLVGDFLYSKAFVMMISPGNFAVLDLLSRTTNLISEGEVMQLLNVQQVDLSEQQYLSMVYHKTACLFEASCAAAACLAEAGEAVVDAMKRYGRHLGMAFQMIDDVLDYTAEEAKTGKARGSDFAEGKMTLPLIHALQTAPPTDRDRIMAALQGDRPEHLEAVVAVMQSCGSFEYVRRRANKESERARRALAVIADSLAKQNMIDLVQQMLVRSS